MWQELHEELTDREIHADDYVFYAIFEWQDRKSPERTMEAFFRALPKDENAILILKTNPGAASIARQALEEIRRRTGSRARAVVRAEAWTELASSSRTTWPYSSFGHF